MMIPQRTYRKDIKLSIIGFGGMVVVDQEQSSANTLVADSIDMGVNYFDVAPQYGDGEAERKLGKALRPYRDDVFLACKTLRRDARGAREELERSLKRLQTDYFDLYQLHSVSTMEDVDAVLASGGAIETFLKAREEGLVRFIGFSSHLEAAALDLLERFDFDSILFPTNFVCWYQGNFGPRVLQKAEENGVSRLALKSLALRPWGENEEQKYPNCWYHPIESEELAKRAINFTLRQNVTALIPPGDANLYRMALNIADRGYFQSSNSEDSLREIAKKFPPLFSTQSEN